MSKRKSKKPPPVQQTPASPCPKNDACSSEGVRRLIHLLAYAASEFDRFGQEGDDDKWEDLGVVLNEVLESVSPRFFEVFGVCRHCFECHPKFEPYPMPTVRVVAG